MKFIQEFQNNDRVIGHYLCKQKQTLRTRADKSYYSLRLQDKTGIIEAKVWEITGDIQDFEEGDYIKVDGLVHTYMSELQMKVSKIRKSEPGECDPADYIPSTSKDIGQLYSQIVDYINSIENGYIKGMMENIIIRNEEIAQAFKIRSAAKSMHHSFMGGLLEHTVTVVQICDFLSGIYPEADRDILISGAILHDIGKIYELSDFPLNDYTDDGRLLGHVIIGASIVEKAAGEIPGFPHTLAVLLRHCVLSHHGEYEFGSPKRPKILEALILHAADNMDAKVKAFQDSIAVSPGTWTGFHKMFERYLRKTDYEK